MNDKGKTPSPDPLKISDFEIAMLIAERDVSQYRVERYDELFAKLGQARGFEDAAKEESTTEKKGDTKEQKPATVSETTFAILKFEPQTGAKIGEYEVSYKTNNIEDKWTHAHNILRNSNATINSRYHGEGYQFSYWLYGEGKIYRQKLKPKT